MPRFKGPWLPLTCLALALLGPACKHAEGPVPFEEAPPVVAEAEPEGEPEPTPELAAKDCPAEVSDVPAPYFGDRVLIRLPKGVSEDSFVEFSPVLARLGGAVESTNCVEGMPGAMINFMAMTIFADDTSRTLESIRDELLTNFGYPETSAIVEESPRGPRSKTWVYEVPPTKTMVEPAKILLAIVEKGGSMVGVVYEVHPNAWSAIAKTLEESSQRIVFIPQP